MMSTPLRAALVIPETTETGVLMTKAQGQASTSSVSPRRNQAPGLPVIETGTPPAPTVVEPSIARGGTTAASRARPTTTGV